MKKGFSNKGFSLVELIIVIAIMAILVAIACKAPNDYVNLLFLGQIKLADEKPFAFYLPLFSKVSVFFGVFIHGLQNHKHAC